KCVIERFFRSSDFRERERRAEQVAGAESTENIFPRPVKSRALSGSCGNHGQDASLSAGIPDKSTTLAPEVRASFRLAAVNWGEPAKKMRFAWLKLSSSTGWITAASPPASVRVPAAISSSRRRKSAAAKRLSSRRDFSSAPRREDAPAMT